MLTSTTDALIGLDSINWSQLSQAYGPADDVPTLLRALQSADSEVYLTGYDACLSNIYHQGSRYSASVKAVPFLYALLGRQTTKNRQSLLYLITSLAVGHPDSSVPNGVDVAKWEKQIANTQEPSASEHSHYEFATYEAAERGLSSVIRYLEEESPAMRATAAHALAFFPRHSDTSAAALFGLLSRETCSVVRSTIVLAIAILFVPVNDYSKKSNIIQQLRGYYAAGGGVGVADDIFTWSCAIALTILGPVQEELVARARRALTDETYVSELEASITRDTWFPFALCDLRQLANTVLEKSKSLSTTPSLTPSG